MWKVGLNRAVGKGVRKGWKILQGLQLRDCFPGGCEAGGKQCFSSTESKKRNTKYGEISFFIWDSLLEKAGEKFGTCQTQAKHPVDV